MIYVLDLDGTLIDSTARHGALLKTILDKRGIEYPTDLENDYLRFKRNGQTTVHNLADRLELDYSVSKAVAKEWVEHIEDWEWVSLDVLYEDSIPFLEKVSKTSIIFYLSSRKSHVCLLQELEKLQITRFAEKVFCVSPKEGFQAKSAVLNQIKRVYQERIIVYGDSEIDYKASQSAGCESYLLNRGFRSFDYWNSIGIMSHYSLLE